MAILEKNKMGFFGSVFQLSQFRADRNQHLRLEVESRQMILGGLGSADQLYRTIGAQHQFFGPQAAVVVEPHSMTVRTGIVDA